MDRTRATLPLWVAMLTSGCMIVLLRRQYKCALINIDTRTSSTARLRIYYVGKCTEQGTKSCLQVIAHVLIAQVLQCQRWMIRNQRLVRRCPLF